MPYPTCSCSRVQVTFVTCISGKSCLNHLDTLPWSLKACEVSCRLGMLPAEQAAPLKLLEKGVSKEALAGLVLLEFPCELASAVLAGRWASSPTPFTPFMLGYKIRLVMAAAVTLVVSHVS
jgi:PAT family acetyl-CoA transporter-like MFS transporter 1